MEKIKSYDVALPLIKEADEQFGVLWKINVECLDIFRSYCEAIDSVMKEFSGVSMEFEIDSITMEISVSIECDSIRIYKPTDAVFQLMERAVYFRAGIPKDDNGNPDYSGDTLIVTFGFPSLWEKTI